MNKKIIFIIILMIVTCILSIVTSIIGLVSLNKPVKNKETIVYVPIETPSSKDDEKEQEKPSSTEEDKPSQFEEADLYTDNDGNTYELIRRYTANDGRKLVLYMNVESKQISLSTESYFDENFKKVNSHDSI